MIDRCIYKKTYYVRLAHMIIEAEKSHDLPPASCRPRDSRWYSCRQSPKNCESGEPVVSPSLSLRSQETEVPFSKDKRRCMSQLK